jgi:hypothetical protein
LHYFRNKAQTYSILSAFEKINQVKNMIIVKNHNLRGLSRLKPLYLLLFFENGRQDQSLLRASQNRTRQRQPWPAEYLFKFIVLSDNEKIAKVESAFDRMGAVIRTNQSKTGKFTSISIDVTMPDADSIVSKYRK